MRTIGVTAGASEPPFAICPRLSMYCSESRSARPSHGLCSISNTTPSNFDALIAIAESISAGEKAVKAGWPCFERADDAIEARKFGHAVLLGTNFAQLARAVEHRGYSRSDVRLTSEVGRLSGLTIAGRP